MRHGDIEEVFAAAISLETRNCNESDDGCNESKLEIGGLKIDSY